MGFPHAVYLVTMGLVFRMGLIVPLVRGARLSPTVFPEITDDSPTLSSSAVPMSPPTSLHSFTVTHTNTWSIHGESTSSSDMSETPTTTESVHTSTIQGRVTSAPYTLHSSIEIIDGKENISKATVPSEHGKITSPTTRNVNFTPSELNLIHGQSNGQRARDTSVPSGVPDDSGTVVHSNNPSLVTDTEVETMSQTSESILSTSTHESDSNETMGQTSESILSTSTHESDSNETMGQTSESILSTSTHESDSNETMGQMSESILPTSTHESDSNETKGHTSESILSISTHESDSNETMGQTSESILSTSTHESDSNETMGQTSESILSTSTHEIVSDNISHRTSQSDVSIGASEFDSNASSTQTSESILSTSTHENDNDETRDQDLSTGAYYNDSDSSLSRTTQSDFTTRVSHLATTEYFQASMLTALTEEYTSHSTDGSPQPTPPLPASPTSIHTSQTHVPEQTTNVTVFRQSQTTPPLSTVGHTGTSVGGGMLTASATPTQPLVTGYAIDTATSASEFGLSGTTPEEVPTSSTTDLVPGSLPSAYLPADSSSAVVMETHTLSSSLMDFTEKLKPVATTQESGPGTFVPEVPKGDSSVPYSKVTPSGESVFHTASIPQLSPISTETPKRPDIPLATTPTTTRKARFPTLKPIPSTTPRPGTVSRSTNPAKTKPTFKEETTPPMYVTFIFKMSMSEFCYSVGKFQFIVSQVLTNRTGESVVAEQVAVWHGHEKCPTRYSSLRLYVRRRRSNEELPIHVYIINAKGKFYFNMTVALIASLIENKMSELQRSPAFRDKLLDFTIHANGVEVVPTHKDFDQAAGVKKSGLAAGIIATITVSAVLAVCLLALLSIKLTLQKQRGGMKKMRHSAETRTSLEYQSLAESVRMSTMSCKDKSYGYINAALDVGEKDLNSMPLTFAGMDNILMNPELIEEEFIILPGKVTKCSVVPPGAEDKNRYSNVLPEPETQVVLGQTVSAVCCPEAVTCKTYINANFIRGHLCCPKSYIATQAPMENTAEDFWRMCWEQQCQAILMLTGLEENGMSKCYEYWPNTDGADTTRQYGAYQVALMAREIHPEWIMSLLILKDTQTGQTREVVHFWLTAWPVNGSNPDARTIINFLLEARPFMEDSLGPTIVHCSSGTGRTGTLLAVDIQMISYDDTKIVDVLSCVTRLRQDRTGCVQTTYQYLFIYKVLYAYANMIHSRHPSMASSLASFQTDKIDETSQ